MTTQIERLQWPSTDRTFKHKNSLLISAAIRQYYSKYSCKLTSTYVSYKDEHSAAKKLPVDGSSRFTHVWHGNNNSLQTRRLSTRNRRDVVDINCLNRWQAAFIPKILLHLLYSHTGTTYIIHLKLHLPGLCLFFSFNVIIFCQMYTSLHRNPNIGTLFSPHFTFL